MKKKLMLKTLDLFSGIGGFSIGLERAGFETVAFCEIDKYCRLVLKKHWKDIKVYPDVREITKRQLEEDGCELPEVITGGVPCQPFSVAGRQKGSGDNRHLWPEMFRVIKEFKSRWIIIENVRGLINIQDGVVFETVHTDLESQGYETQTFIIPAAGVGAPHRRDRVWIVAHSDLNHAKQSIRKSNEAQRGIQEEYRQDYSSARESSRTSSVRQTNDGYEDVAHSRRTIRGQQSSRNKESIESGTSQETKRSADSDSVARSSEREKIMANSNEGNVETGRQRQRGIRTESKRLGISSDASSSGQAMANSKRVYVQGQQDRSRQKQSRRSGWWDIEPDVGRVADGVPGRIHRLKGLGNSIIPQIAEEIGRAILKAEYGD